MTKKKELKLSIIIVNYNFKHFIKLAIEALERNNTNFDYEIIVVDNNSTDPESLKFLELAEKANRIDRLIKSPKNLGFGKGNNLGVSYAKGKYIFLHNPDVTTRENTLNEIVDYMDTTTDVGIMGTKLIYPSGAVQDNYRRNMKFFDLIIKRTFLNKLPVFKKRVDNYLMKDIDRNKITEVDLLTGASMVIPRHVYQQVNGFDDRYFMFMEDFDICREIKNAGYKIVYNPNIEIDHYHKRLSEGHNLSLIFKKMAWLHLISSIKYFWKWKNKK